MNVVNKSGAIYFLGAQYFLYFGVLGIYLPYFNLYLHHLDFSAAQIGVISMMRSVSMMIFPALWAKSADRYQTRHLIFILCCLVSTLIWSLYLTASSFIGVFFITVLYGVFFAPIISFLEAYSMEILMNRKSDYGKIRVWGTLSFIIISITAGYAINWFPIRHIIIWILAGSAIQALISLKAPKTTAPPPTPLTVNQSAFKDKRVIIFLLAALLMLLSHGAYYGFFSIHLEKLGYSSGFIGGLWSLAAMAEIFVMLYYQRIVRLATYQNLLFFTFMIAAIRWFMLSSTNSSAIIIITQLMHSCTYGVFHITSILYIDQLIPASKRTTAQAVNNAVTYGLGISLGFLMNGLLFEALGGHAMFFISGIIALLAGTAFKIFQPKSS